MKVRVNPVETIGSTEAEAASAKIYHDLPQPPVFSGVEEERLHRKQRLAASFRLFSKFGFDEGVVGHITARDPQFTHTFWVNPFVLTQKGSVNSGSRAVIWPTP